MTTDPARLILLVAAALAAMTASAAAAAPRWVASGSLLGPTLPDGPRIVDPGSSGVLYLPQAWSRNGGRSWQPSPLARLGRDALFGFSSSSPGLVYAVGRDGS